MLLSSLLSLFVMYLWPKEGILYPESVGDFVEVFVALQVIPFIFNKRHLGNKRFCSYCPPMISLFGLALFLALVDGAPIDVASFMVIHALLAQTLLAWGLGRLVNGGKQGL